jgi:hypothetical protein
MLYQSVVRRGVGGRCTPRRALIRDDLVIEALQPVSILQIGVPGQLLNDDYGAVSVSKVNSLDEAISAMACDEFDAIVFGSGIVDAWPTAAYEEIAGLAGSTPVLVQTGFVAPMAAIKQQQDRNQDIIVGTAKPSLLGRLALTAIMRNRALAEELGTPIG